jgi:zinc/manganese transport system substrate-binding protein
VPLIRNRLAAALLAATALLVSGCDRSAPPAVVSSPRGPAFSVLAAEGFWGSIAAQLAGSRARVQSVVTEPGQDPHSYQPTAADARAVAAAKVVIVNGLGYDDWATQLLEASASPQRDLIDVGRALRLPAGSNPHRWYYPGDVDRVVALITSTYERVDPADAAYFARRRTAFLSIALARYDRLRTEIARRYAGLPVGYSETVFQGLGEDLHLRLATPYGFAKAIAEGTDVSATDKRAIDAAVAGRRIAVWIYNRQNVTPDVQRINGLAAERGIPVVAVSETPEPAGADFQSWQTAQLEALFAALHSATGR